MEPTKTPNNLRPFNLEAALAGKPVVTRNNIKIVQIAHFPTGRNPIVAQLADNHGIEMFQVDGAYLGGVPHRLDLFMAPVQDTVYILLYMAIFPSASYSRKAVVRTFDSLPTAQAYAFNHKEALLTPQPIPITYDKE